MNNRLFVCFGWHLFILLQCISCTHHAYEGNTKPYEEIAVINDSFTGSMRWDRASISAVDDETWKLSRWSMREQVEVLPGEHSVAIYCWHGFGPGSNVGLQGRLGSVTFNAEAGHDYQVFCSVSNGRYVRWIEDLTTGEIAGEDGK